MPYRMRWTEQGAAKSEEVVSAKLAQLRRIELLGKGYADVEVRDDAGKRLNSFELAHLLMIEQGSS